MRISRLLKLTLILGSALAVAALFIEFPGGDSTVPVTTQPPAATTGQSNAHEHADDPAHARPRFVRTLTVSAVKEPPPSASANDMRAVLIDGELPHNAIEATVLSDEDCEPDKDGVSHCRNRLRLRGGSELTVRHPHRMHDVPCMTPGEIVRMRRAVSV
jgi:hypothetical protein